MKDVTLDKAIDECRLEEVSARRIQELMGEGSSEVHKIHKKSEERKCKFCGGRHVFEKGVCPAFGQKCRRCKGRNHYEKMCSAQEKMKKKVKAIKNDTEDDSSEAGGRENSDDSESEYEREIGKIHNRASKGGHVLADLRLKFNNQWKSVKCELDTGANTSLIGYNCLRKLSDDVELVLLPSKLKLQSFGGGSIPVLGEVKIPCQHKGLKVKLVFQVVDVDHRPLLSANVCDSLGLVKFCNSVTYNGSSGEPIDLWKVHRVEAERIVAKHESVFQGYGKMPGEVSLEIDSTVKPQIQQPRRIPMALREKLRSELGKLEENGIIAKEPRHTDWVSNILLVNRSANGESFRICLDPIPLNKALKRPNLQFTTLDEILPELGRAKVFSTMDAKKGFWQVSLDEPSSLLTTFWTPFGRYRWTRLPFGISSAPEVFQTKLRAVVQDLDGVECLADDLLVFGRGETLEEAMIDHEICLDRLLCRLEQNNVKLNRSKLRLCQPSVKFFGNVLSDQGLRADESKVAVIKNFPTPTDRKELHRFVGMVNYLSRFIPNLSADLFNLRKLISEKVPWCWGPTEQHDFETVKAKVADTRTLKYYDMSQPLWIECDASCFGLGVAVYQADKVIGYASRTLTPTERNYAQIEKELLAVLFACVKFDQLIIGNAQTVVKTDHKPLINVFNKPLLKAPKRLQHMLLNLQRYNIQLQFVTGKDNVVADAISRAPDPIGSDPAEFRKLNIYRVLGEIENINLSGFLSISDDQINEIIEHTASDNVLQTVVHYVRNGWPEKVDRVAASVRPFFKFRHELSVQNGLVFWSDRIVIPVSLHRSLIDKLHVSHSGMESTLRLARSNIFWPGMTDHIRNRIQDCSVCAKFAPSQQHPPMKSHAIPVYPFQLVSMDVFFQEHQGKQRKFLITVDHYSDFFELDLLKDLTPRSVIESCKRNFARHGTPQLVVTDNGTNFVNEEMVNFAKAWGFKHATSSPYHQQANGKAEAAVKISKNLIKKAKEAGQDLWYVLQHWRNIPNSIGSSPVSRLFSRSIRCGLPMPASNLFPRVIEGVPDSIKKSRQKAKQVYDKKSRCLPQFEAGSPVYVQLRPDSSKLWVPGVVDQQLSDRSYLINVEGANYRRDAVNVKQRSDPVPPLVDTRPAEEISSVPVVADNPNVESDSATLPSCPLNVSTGPHNAETSSEQITTTYASITPAKGRPRRDSKMPVKYKDYVL